MLERRRRFIVEMSLHASKLDTASIHQSLMCLMDCWWESQRISFVKCVRHSSLGGYLKIKYSLLLTIAHWESRKFVDNRILLTIFHFTFISVVVFFSSLHLRWIHFVSAWNLPWNSFIWFDFRENTKHESIFIEHTKIQSRQVSGCPMRYFCFKSEKLRQARFETCHWRSYNAITDHYCSMSTSCYTSRRNSKSCICVSLCALCKCSSRLRRQFVSLPCFSFLGHHCASVSLFLIIDSHTS
jgi:hypothetical protein